MSEHDAPENWEAKQHVPNPPAPQEPEQPKEPTYEEPTVQEPPPPPPPPVGPASGGPWTTRVRLSDRGYAYTPGEIVVVGEAAANAAGALVEQFAREKSRVSQINGNDLLVSGPDSLDVAMIVAELRHVGYRAEPNYVMFGHSGGCCSCCQGGAHANPVFASPVFASGAQANPVFASSVGANPVFASPVFASPVFASPVFASPVFASPVFASPVFASYRDTGARPSTARPAADPKRKAPALPGPGGERVFILDTGIAEESQLPALINHAPHDSAPVRDRELPDEDRDNYLDPAAGHGTFIAGIIEQLAPGRMVEVHSVLTTFGDGKVSEIVQRLDELIAADRFDDRTIINLSFGGYADGESIALASAIRRVQRTGAVVVASAGNDGVCAPQFPAALPDVVAVASIDAYGPAPYSNHGPWVRACAPGTDVVSSFFADFDGDAPVSPVPGGSDPDRFESWARWTGTSFAAPIVAAALVRHMALTGVNAKEAVAQIIDDPGLYRVPNFGTVINLSLS